MLMHLEHQQSSATRQFCKNKLFSRVYSLDNKMMAIFVVLTSNPVTIV